MPDPSVAVCICTRNRPNDLRKTLQSIAESARSVDQVVVSDDGTDRPVKELCASFEALAITYVEGPRVGLGANRNAALGPVQTDHVLFMDDDCLLAPDFFDVALACMAEHEARVGTDLVIVSGTEDQRGRVVDAGDQSFLGFQEKPYASDRGRRSIVINATVFPTRLFRVEAFDRQLVYGYDEVDLATRAVAAGFEIVACPAARNRHFPSPAARDDHRAHVHASRMYVTFKRYALTERRPGKAAAYALVAPAHLVVRGDRRGAAHALRLAARYTRQNWRSRQDKPIL